MTPSSKQVAVAPIVTLKCFLFPFQVRKCGAAQRLRNANTENGSTSKKFIFYFFDESSVSAVLKTTGVELILGLKVLCAKF